jgi:hypothetical protein
LQLLHFTNDLQKMILTSIVDQWLNNSTLSKAIKTALDRMGSATAKDTLLQVMDETVTEKYFKQQFSLALQDLSDTICKSIKEQANIDSNLLFEVPLMVRQLDSVKSKLKLDNVSEAADILSKHLELKIKDATLLYKDTTKSLQKDHIPFLERLLSNWRHSLKQKMQKTFQDFVVVKVLRKFDRLVEASVESQFQDNQFLTEEQGDDAPLTEQRQTEDGGATELTEEIAKTLLRRNQLLLEETASMRLSQQVQGDILEQRHFTGGMLSHQGVVVRKELSHHALEQEQPEKINFDMKSVRIQCRKCNFTITLPAQIPKWPSVASHALAQREGGVFASVAEHWKFCDNEILDIGFPEYFYDAMKHLQTQSP